MKIRNFFSILIINFMLLVLVSLYQEYVGMHQTFQRLDSNFDLAVDSAINSSIGSEEMFSDRFVGYFLSESTSMDRTRILYSTTKVYRDGAWITGNNYIMAMYYNLNGSFPTTQIEYDMYANTITVEKIYNYLFGNNGSDEGDASLAWANKSSGVSVVGGAGRLVTNNNFLNFYNGVGHLITSSVPCKQKNGNSWISKDVTLPILTQMGLKLNSYNEVTSPITNVNFTSTSHDAKFNSVYYFTPASLGVTYLPIEILKPTILSHLEQKIRFSKNMLDPLSNTAAEINLSYENSNGCINTNVYDDGSGNISSTALEHRVSNVLPTYTETSDILNDGYVEYDMSTLKVKVDYFVIDFFNDDNWKIATNIYGATPHEPDLTTLPSRLKAASTKLDTSGSINSNNNGTKIVAKVTVKCKIHIPYRSSIIQWFIQATSSDIDEHYDIKLWDNTSKTIIEDSDGVWYQYSKFIVTN